MFAASKRWSRERSAGVLTGAAVVFGLSLVLLVVVLLNRDSNEADPVLAPLGRLSDREFAAVEREPKPPTMWVIDGAETSTVNSEIQSAALDSPALFVDVEAGSSSNPGTLEEPFETPRQAFRVVEPGTTIYLRSGVYNDREISDNILRRSGTPDAWITIKPYPGERVEIRAGGEWGNGFEFQGASYIRVEGFIIIGHEDSIHGSGVFAKDNSHDIVVSGNYIQGFGGAGVSFVRSSRVVVEGNEIRDNAHRSFYQSSGISLFEAEGPTNGVAIDSFDIDGVSFDNIVRNNYVVGNYNGVPARDGRITDGNCIIVDWFNPVGYQGSTLVENNVCVENGGRGIHVFNASNVLARNNTLIGNGRTINLTGSRAELTAVDGTNIQFYNNLVLNGPDVDAYVQNRADDAIFANNYVASGPPPGDGNRELTLAPSEVLSSLSSASALGELRPSPNSPVVGAGTAVLQPRFDATGVLRPEIGAVGALEPTP